MSVPRRRRAARRGRIYVMGTAMAGRGGIAAVLSAYAAAGLLTRFPTRMLVSHAEGPVWLRLKLALQAGIQLAWGLLTRDVALLHVHSASRSSFLRKSIYLAMARCMGVPTLFHLHGGEFHVFVDTEAGPWLRRWILHTLRRADVVMALSEHWKDYVLSLVPGQLVVVLPNPVKMPAAPDGALERPGRILFLGRVERAKGVFELVEALALLRARGVDAHLVVGGEGELARLKSHAQGLGLADECVVLRGWVEPAEKALLLHSAQVFALPSHAEGVPMAMLEAMSYGRAMVLSRVGGMPEAVTDGEQGLLVPPEDPQALADALARLLTDPALRHRLGDAARSKAQQRYGVDGVVQKLASLYEDLGAVATQTSDASQNGHGTKS